MSNRRYYLKEGARFLPTAKAVGIRRAYLMIEPDGTICRCNYGQSVKNFEQEMKDIVQDIDKIHKCDDKEILLPLYLYNTLNQYLAKKRGYTLTNSLL